MRFWLFLAVAALIGGLGWRAFHLAAAQDTPAPAGHHHHHHGRHHGTHSAHAEACTTVTPVAWAPATSGASIQGVPVLPCRMHPGRTYTLRVYVSQGGSAPERMRLYLERLSAGHGKTVPPSWFTAPDVTVAPGQGTEASFTLTVPAAAEPGRYFSDIAVAAAPAGGTPAGGAVLGAAAATKLIFRLAA